MKAIVCDDNVISDLSIQNISLNLKAKCTKDIKQTFMALQG